MYDIGQLPEDEIFLLAQYPMLMKVNPLLMTLRKDLTLTFSHCKLQNAFYRLQFADLSLQVVLCRLQFPDCSLQMTACRFLTGIESETESEI